MVTVFTLHDEKEMTKIALIDNYDSFTYNLRQLLEEEGAKVDVLRNDQFALPDLEIYDKLVLSPGPGIPSEAGLLNDVIRTYAPSKPILGVCLGEQAIGEVFGAKLTNLSEVFHGVQTPAHIVADDYIYSGLDTTFLIGRYHSWVVDKADFPTDLEITCVSDEGLIMGLRHRTLDVHGIQFHPESVLTPEGRTIIHNFVSAS